MRRVLFWLLLPIVWVPAIGATALIAPRLPSWAFFIALAVIIGIVRMYRARRGSGGLLEVDPAGPRWNPLGRGGGL